MRPRFYPGNGSFTAPPGGIVFGCVEAAAELCFQRGDARLQRFVLLARDPGHFLHRLEILALDHVEIAQDALGLALEQGVELAPHARSDAGGIVHQPRHLVENPAAGLGHRRLRPVI